MIEARTQSPFQATTDLVRAWTLAANLPAIQAMTFWTRVLRSPLLLAEVTVSTSQTSSACATSAAEAPLADASCEPAEEAATDAPEAPVATETPADAGFSSYRSFGGHAVAQVIVPEGN